MLKLLYGLTEKQMQEVARELRLSDWRYLALQMIEDEEIEDAEGLCFSKIDYELIALRVEDVWLDCIGEFDETDAVTECIHDYIREYRHELKPKYIVRFSEDHTGWAILASFNDYTKALEEFENQIQEDNKNGWKGHITQIVDVAGNILLEYSDN